MGQTDSQFKAYLRLIYDDLTEIKEEDDKEKHDKKIEKLLNILRETLED